ncbi:MAG: hypothetical protein WCZ19_05630, partial [Acholeplasma sp.]
QNQERQSPSILLSCTKEDRACTQIRSCEIDFEEEFGQITTIDISGLTSEGQTAFFVYNNEIITLASNPEFLISGSTNLTLVVKEPSDYVALFMDTNGELLDFEYNPIGTPSTLSVPTKPGYNPATFDTTVIIEDTIFIAEYVKSNESSILVTIDGGTKDLTDPKFNDVVTVTSTTPGFTHWEDEFGQVVSYSSTYQFTVLNDIELTASTDGVITPNIYMRDVTGIRTNHLSYYGYVEYDELDFTLVEYGFLGGTTDGILKVSDIVYVPSTAIANNEFLRSFTAESQLYNTTAYAILKNNTDSSLTTIYSDGKQLYDISFNLTVPVDTSNTIYLVGGFSGTSWNPLSAIEITNNNGLYVLDAQFIAKADEILTYKILEGKSYDFEANYSGTDNSDRTYTFTTQKVDSINLTVSSWRGIHRIYFRNDAGWPGPFTIGWWGDNTGTSWSGLQSLVPLNEDVFYYDIFVLNRSSFDYGFRFDDGNSSPDLQYSPTLNYFILTGYTEGIGWTFNIIEFNE